MNQRELLKLMDKIHDIMAELEAEPVEDNPFAYGRGVMEGKIEAYHWILSELSDILLARHVKINTEITEMQEEALTHSNLLYKVTVEKSVMLERLSNLPSEETKERETVIQRINWLSKIEAWAQHMLVYITRDRAVLDEERRKIEETLQ